MRHIIELMVTHRDEENETGYRRHIITLSNNDAVSRVTDSITDGRGWHNVVSIDDILEYDDELDT